MKVLSLKNIILISALNLLLMVMSAYAGETLKTAAEETPQAFLEGLNGKFRGRGEAIIELTNRQERVSCKLANTLADDTKVLSISGICATTQGKASVDGKLEVVDGKVVGSFLSPFNDSEITQSHSNFSDGKLVLSTSFVNKDTGNLSRTRQIVVSNESGGFNSTFQKFDNSAGDYKDTGYVEFSPVGE